MNKEKLRDIKQYIGTVIFALSITLVMCFAMQFELYYRCEQKVSLEEFNTKNLLEFFTLDELEKQLKENPNNYEICIKLARIYEKLGQFDKANEFYKDALSISGRNNFALYSYALFCAKNDLFVFAATLAEQLSGTNIQTNTYKAKIYEHIASGLSKQKNYPASVKSYQIVYKYAKSIGKKAYIKDIKEKYALEYIKLADLHVAQKEAELAISDLNNSLALKKTADAYYKLGLIYLQIDDVKAEKYINKAFYMNPVIVNPHIYNHLLTKLEDNAKKNKKEALVNFYKIRGKNFETKLSQIYLFKNDIEISNNRFLLKKSRFFSKKKYFLCFDIKNNTAFDINGLNLKLEIYLNSEKYIIEKKIFSRSEPISAGAKKQVALDLTNEVNFSNLDENNDLILRFFAKKEKKAPWILLKIDLVNI